MTVNLDSNTYYPSRVERHQDRRELEIRWRSGAEVTVIPYDELRGYCPCAGCQGHMVQEVRFRPPKRRAEPLVISPVGNYALSILWSDGHSTGIYRYDVLAQMPERTQRRLASAEPALP